MKKTFCEICIALLMLTGTYVMSDSPALAADQERAQEQIQTQEQIYGSQLMTTREREEYRNRIRTAKTYEEREKIRNEHHERMKERAKEQGMTLPNAPPERSMGRGMGSGIGMGPGGGGKGQGGRNR